MRLYGSIQKVDAEKRTVAGYASTESVDHAGETVTKAAIEGALDDYLAWANIREMHQPSAVGTAEEASVDDKGLFLVAKIVDDAAWAKVVAGVYKGFSIGGKVIARDPLNKKTITKIALHEISIVDRPSNPDARFDVWKAASIESENMPEPKDEKIERAIAEKAALGLIAAEALAKAAADAAAKPDPGLAGAAVAEALAKKVAAEAELEAAAANAETAEHVAELAKAEKGLEPAAAEPAETVIDPLTKATAAVEALAAALAPADDALAKGMYEVGRFAELLNSLSYMVLSSEYEADSEGDKSPVPAKLRDWLKSGAGIFKEMAKEEADELVAAGKVKKAAEAEAIAQAATEAADGLAKVAATDALAKAETATSDLAKALALRDEALSKIAETVEPLTKAVEAMAKRLAVVEASPAPSKTAGPGASISKGEDSGGLAKVAIPDGDELTKALAAMPDNERAMLLIKAAQKLPRDFAYRSANI